MQNKLNNTLQRKAGDSDAIVQFSNSSHKTHLTIDGDIYVNEGRDIVASQNWANNSYALKTDLSSDVTATTEGTATLGASGGAARYGQKGDVKLGNVDNVKQYSASNPPPYPVTSVNGQTGAVVVKIDDGAL